VICHINKNLVISTEQEKKHLKEYPFIIKTIGVYLNTIKAIYDKPTASRPNGENLKLSSKIWNKTKDAHFAKYIQDSSGSPSQSNWTRQREGIQIGKRKLNCLFVGNIIYIHTYRTLKTKKSCRPNKLYKVIKYKKEHTKISSISTH
jgi:hypothetical protein